MIAYTFFLFNFPYVIIYWIDADAVWTNKTGLFLRSMSMECMFWFAEQVVCHGCVLSRYSCSKHASCTVKDEFVAQFCTVPPFPTKVNQFDFGKNVLKQYWLTIRGQYIVLQFSPNNNGSIERGQPQKTMGLIYNMDQYGSLSLRKKNKCPPSGPWVNSQFSSHQLVEWPRSLNESVHHFESRECSGWMKPTRNRKKRLRMTVVRTKKHVFFTGGCGGRGSGFKTPHGVFFSGVTDSDQHGFRCQKSFKRSLYEKVPWYC